MGEISTIHNKVGLLGMNGLTWSCTALPSVGSCTAVSENMTVLIQFPYNTVVNTYICNDVTKP